MAFERSHGKPRPTLPRSSDLGVVPEGGAAGGRRGKRDAAGRFATGNVVGRGRGWKRAIAGLLGRDVEDPVAQRVADDARRVYCATLRELPSDGAIVRGLAALKARHEALAGFWHAHAAVVGLTSDQGVRASDQATKHGQRAERLTVTMLDAARALARPKDDDFAAEVARADAEAEAATDARRVDERRRRDQAAADDADVDPPAPEPPESVTPPRVEAP